MSDLFSMYVKYGGLIAAVGLLGMICIELLKRPLKAVLSSKFPAVLVSDQKFDAVAFLFGFIVACILGAIYTLLMPALGMLEEGKVLVKNYLTNMIGTWMFQTIYYSIYKKLGIKAIFAIIGKAIIKVFDRNGDDKVEIQEALITIQNLMADGKLDKEEVAKIAEKAAQEAAIQITRAANIAAKIDQATQVQKLVDTSNNLIATIPNDKVQIIAERAVKLAESKANEIITNPVAQQEITKPTIKF